MMTQLNNIKLTTPRLYLIPLSYHQLLMYANADDLLEDQLNLLKRKRELTEELKSTLEKYLIPYINLNPSHILYATIWVIVHKSLNVIVGDIGFNAAPTEKGVIEVGYSTFPDFMNRGYMTEALNCLVKWAFDQPEVKIIIAQTAKDNYPTHKVLNKNNFSPFAEADSFYWWRLDKDDETVKDS